MQKAGIYALEHTEITDKICEKYSRRLNLLTEALNAIIKFAFEKKGLNRLEAFHRGKNQASSKVLQKSEIKYEGTLRQSFFYKDINDYDDTIYYGILRNDYFNQTWF